MIVYLNITNYLMCPGAEHWYGTLVGDRGPGLYSKEVELKHKLTESGAARMNRREGGDWEAGEETNRFFREEQVREEALLRYKRMFPEATILVDGRHGVCDPQPVMDGPPKIMETANRFVEEANEIGWWEGDEHAMEEICERWDDFWEEVKCTHSPIA
jgi:hypothetical protein